MNYNLKFEGLPVDVQRVAYGHLKGVLAVLKDKPGVPDDEDELEDLAELLAMNLAWNAKERESQGQDKISPEDHTQEVSKLFKEWETDQDDALLEELADEDEKKDNPEDEDED